MSDESEILVESPRAGKPEFLTTTRFESFTLPPEVHLGLADAGFEFCTQIQAEALPALLQGAGTWPARRIRAPARPPPSS